MIILLGGFLGSGRGRLARALSKRHGFHYYDMNQKKPQYGFFDKKGRLKEKAQRPKSDAARMRMYKSVTADFPRLSKMYPDTIIQASFHRKQSREYLLEEARRYFDKVIFVWIESDGKHTEKNLLRMEKRAKIRSIEQGKRRMKGMRKAFEAFQDTPHSFSFVVSGPKSAEHLWDRIRSASCS